jgi:hypothetical protein
MAEMVKEKRTQTVAEIRRFVDRLLAEKPEYCGYVQCNFHKGSLANINLHETIMLHPEHNRN